MDSENQALTNPQDFSNLTPDQILQFLDSGWPWPLSTVQEWFEDLWDMILEYFHRVVDWVADKVRPIINQVWNWVYSAADWVVSHIESLLSDVWDWIESSADWLWSHIQSALDTIEYLLGDIWDWVISARDWLWAHIQPVLNNIWNTLGTIPGLVTQRIGEIKTWFSGEFIDPFIDWLLKLPGNLWKVFEEMLNRLLTRLDTFMTVQSPGIGRWFGNWLNRAWAWLQVRAATYWDELKKEVKDFKSPLWIAWYTIAGIAVAATIGALTAAGGAIVGALRLAAGAILRLAPAIGGWFLTVFSKVGGWLVSGGTALGSWLVGLLPRLLTWLGAKWFPLFSSALVLGLGATGKLDDLIDRFITPKVMELMSWAESMGPVSPGTGVNAMTSVTKLITFTVSGLATMTLMGESLSFFKHLGMGHISAMLYDVSNYKILTGAFVGVLAYVYIRKPLEYYYNKIARPNIPSERDLISLVGEYAITKEKYQETMQYHGYPQEWITAMYELADRPFSPFLIRYLADAGELDEELLERELHNARYNEKSIPALKDAFRRLAAGELKTLMSGVAIKRYREGLDDQDTLANNLLALGTHPQLIPKYLFGAELDALTDYQLDLLSYYKDAYHRREINDTQFLEALSSIQLDPARSELIYRREKIKRLKVTATPAPVVKTLTAAQIGDLYKIGRLTKDDALGRLGTYLPIAGDRALFLMLYEPTP